MDLTPLIIDFLKTVESGATEIYNEFSLQHELGIYLRNHIQDKKVQFERNVSDFALPKSQFEKKEIDLSITSANLNEKLCAIELKFPRNGQVPESLFSFCKDILFLEQLVQAGFQSAYFLAVVEDKLFYSGADAGIYSYFRTGKTITGRIQKPTGTKSHEVTINGNYTAVWHPITDEMKYCLIAL